MPESLVVAPVLLQRFRAFFLPRIGGLAPRAVTFLRRRGIVYRAHAHAYALVFARS